MKKKRGSPLPSRVSCLTKGRNVSIGMTRCKIIGEKLGAYIMLLKLINIGSPLDIKEKAGSYYGEFWQGEMEEVFSRQD